MKKNIFSVIAGVVAANFFVVSALANNTNSSAKSSQALQVVSGVANAYAGKVYLSTCKGNPMNCVLGALSLAQAASSIAGALQSGKTKNASNCTGSYCNGIDVTGNISPTGTYDSSGTGGVGNLPGETENVLGRIQDDINSNLGSLADKGYSYDAATNSVNTPNGNIAASSFASSSGMKGLGMTDADIAKMDEIGKQALKDAQNLVGSLDFDSSGGGGRKAKPGPGYENAGKDFDMNKYLAGLMNKNDPKRGVAGLEKKYGTDHIGVAQDNIFTMVKRRYEAKKPTLAP